MILSYYLMRNGTRGSLAHNASRWISRMSMPEESRQCRSREKGASAETRNVALEGGCRKRGNHMYNYFHVFVHRNLQSATPFETAKTQLI